MAIGIRAVLRTLILSRAPLAAENAALCHQLAVPQRSSGAVTGDTRASTHDLIAWCSCERWGSTLNRTGRR